MHRFLVFAFAMLALAGCAEQADEPEETQGEPTPAVSEPWMPVWGDLERATIRPNTNAPGCTFDWMFVDPVNQTYYIGIAGHCTSDSDKDQVTDGTGIRVGHSGFSESEAWGTVVYDSDNQTMQSEYGIEDRVDFSLIRLDEAANLMAHPQMMGFPAPVGFIDCADTMIGDRIGWHGYGMVLGQNDITRVRHGALAVCDGKDYGAYTAAIWGDSGSAVVHVDSNKALGIVSRLGIGTTPPTELTGATLPYIFKELAKHPEFKDVKLATIDGGYVGLDA